MADLLKDSFRGFIVPIQVLEDAALSVYEKMVYIVLRSFINPHRSEAWPSISTICSLSGIGRTKVKESIDSLIEKGYITKQINFQYNSDTKKARQTSNVYNVDLPNINADPGRHTTTPPVATRLPPQSPHDHQELINKELINKEHEEEETTIGGAADFDSLNYEKQYEEIKKTLFGDKRAISQSEEWFLLHVIEGKISLKIAKQVVKKINLSSINKKVLFHVIDAAMSKLKTGEVKHPVNWMVGALNNEQLLIELLGGEQWISGKSL